MRYPHSLYVVVGEMTSSRRSTHLKYITKQPSRWPRRKPPPTQDASRRLLRALTSSLSKPHDTKPAEPSLLSLPDEPLAQLISHLSPCTRSFKAPPAYFLAQTNTRLLEIFRSQLTQITPYTSNPTPTTLSCDHLAAVSRLAGDHLRVIHLPEGALWPELADTCPNVEELSFYDDWCTHDIVLYLFERLPLKVLEVVRPCPETLQMLHENASRLQKLILRDISLSRIDPLMPVLNAKPKEMVLEFDFIGCRDNRIVLEELENTVQNIEKLSISMPVMNRTPDEDIETTVNRLRESQQEKTCKDIFLGGVESFYLLQHVDSNAKIAIGYRDCVLRSNAPGEMIHATSLATSHTPKVDISRVEELTIDTPTHPAWIQHLPPLKHVKVLHNDVSPPVMAEIATVPIPSKPYEDWNLPTNELRFVARHLFENELAGVCQTIQDILHRFKGKTVWMDYIHGYDLPEDRDALRPHVRRAKYACESFEQTGGDAGTVLAWLDGLFSRCF